MARALIQLPARMRRALRLFRRITGLTAVTSIATSVPGNAERLALSPPVHPHCARRLRSVPNAPCGEQWLLHVRAGRRSARLHHHVCPIGLRCSCVPVHLGDRLVGVAKLVAKAETPEPALKTARSVLTLLVAGTCQDLAVSLLSEEIDRLRGSLARMRRAGSRRGSSRGGARTANAAIPEAEGTDPAGAALVNRALAHLQEHYRDRTLSLRSVAAALDCHPKYLTNRFTEILGERMHTYLIALRISQASRLLVSTRLQVKEVAAASGFSGAGPLARAFRAQLGVNPLEYRRIFAPP